MEKVEENSWQKEMAFVRCHVDWQQGWVLCCEREKQDHLLRIKLGDEGRTVFLIVFHLRRMFIVSREILRLCPYLNWNRKTVSLQLWSWLASRADLDGCPTWAVRALEAMLSSWPTSRYNTFFCNGAKAFFSFFLNLELKEVIIFKDDSKRWLEADVP